MIKKHIGFFAVLVSVVILSLIHVSAGSPEITLGQVASKPGETVSVPVIISDNPGVISVSVDINYNERQLTLIGVADGDLLPGAMHSDSMHSPYRLQWVNDTSRKNYDASGTLVTLTFRVNENVDADCYLYGSIPKDAIYNFKGEIVDFSVVSNNIEITLPPKTDPAETWTAPTHTDVTRDRSKDEMTVSGDGGKGDSGEQEKWKNPFADVSENDSFYQAVGYVYKNELFRGVSANRFAPHSTMTRAMFVTVLGRLAGVDQSEYTKTSFSDAVAGEWYSAYVEWAAENGIVNGYGNGKFGVNDDVTIEQACAIIARYARHIGISTSAKFLTGYGDTADISDWALDDMAWMTEKELYVPEESKLLPRNKAERALVATMIFRFAERYSLSSK